MEDLSGKPGLNADEWTTFQIGHRLLSIQIKRTKEFYACQPKISANCECGNCEYYENEVINQPNRLFEVLREMGVDLSRQPNINPDGISCIGEITPGRSGYIGYYYVYGEIGNASEKTKKIIDDSRVSEVHFNDSEFGPDTQVTIKQIECDKISFEFYVNVKI